MSASFAILAPLLAPDCIGLPVLFRVVLALLHSLNSLRAHRLHQLRHSLYKMIFHRHH